MVRLDIMLGKCPQKDRSTRVCEREGERNYNLIIHFNNKTKH